MTKEQECMKALQCLYLEVPSVIADDVKQKVIDALNEVKNCSIPAVSGLACKCGNQTFTHRHSNWIECTACNKIHVLQA